MRIDAREIPEKDLLKWGLRVDGVVQPFVLWFDTKEKIAECAMFDKDGRIISTGIWDQYQTDLDDGAVHYTIHRFDVYYDNQLIESVK